MSGKKRIKVHPNSSQEKIEETAEMIEIWIKEKPIEGRANEKVNRVLTKHFGKKVKISSGFNSKYKFVVIED